MSAPRFAPCKCKHARADHESLAPQCSAHGCECLQYRPDVTVTKASPIVRDSTARGAGLPSPAVVAAVSGPTVDQMIAAGKRSQSKRLNALAEKIAAQVEDLRSKLHAERRAADEKRKRDAARQEARAEVARLERELALARARAKGGPSPVVKSAKPAGDGVCPDCGKDGLSNIGVHRAKAHGFRKAV